MSDKLTDLTFIETVAKGNNEFVLKIINSFIKQAGEDIVKLEQFVKDENWEGIHLIGHKMKSSIHFVGISSAKELIANIEKFAQNKINLDQIPRLVEEFIAKCKGAIKELELEIEKLTVK